MLEGKTAVKCISELLEENDWTLPCFLDVPSRIVTTLDSLPSNKDILATLFNGTYDASIAPNFNEEVPTNVTVQLFILSIHSVSEATMEFKIEVILKQVWVDPRLSFGRLANTTRELLELDSSGARKVWEPDTFFFNEKQGSVHKVTTENKLIHIHDNGTVIYSARLSLTLSCTMFLHLYPMDEQVCSIIIYSYAYTTRNILYNWHREWRKPVYFEQEELPQFNIITSKMVLTEDENEYDQTGTYSRLKLDIPLQRKTGFYVLQLFIPCILMVGLSWINFWIDPSATPARVSLGVVTVLTLTTLSSGARQSLPPVSYVKAIDVWMFVCQLFVFVALIEFAYVNALTRQGRKYKANDRQNHSENEAADGNTDEQTICNKLAVRIVTFVYPGYKRQHKYTGDGRARFVDHLSRRLFPTLFSIFLIVFFLYVTSAETKVAEDY